MFRKKRRVKAAEEVPRRRAVSSEPDSAQRFRRGVTMAGERERVVETASERLEERKRRTRRKVGTGVFLVFLGILIVVVGVMILASREEEVDNSPGAEQGTTVLVPTVAIIDENGTEIISSRVKEFVARLERDALEEGIEVDRVVLPAGMIREVDVYVVGREEYYKMIISRSSAEQAEDMGRMVRWLDERGMGVQYVDLRVKGKAYYK